MSNSPEQYPEQLPTPDPRPAPPGFAPAPPKKKGGFAAGFGSGLGFALGAGVVMTVMSIISVIGMVVSLLALPTDGLSSASTSKTVIWGNDSAKGTLRAIEITGVIMADASDGGGLSSGTYGYEVAKTLDDLSADDADGVVLLVNTPGGSIPGSKAIADAVTRYKDRTKNPVLVHVASLSASGGVYSTSTASEIIADHGAMVGSVGVISGPFQQFTNVTAIGDSLFQGGVTAEKITQEYLSAGAGKAFGDAWNPMDPKSREQWLKGINREYDNFVKQVVTNRPVDEAKLRNEYGAGIFDALTAKEYGYVDDIMGRKEFFEHAAKAADLDPADTKVEAYTMPTDFLSSLMGFERVYTKAPPVVQGEGITAVVSPAICEPTRVLAHSGSLKAFCG